MTVGTAQELITAGVDVGTSAVKTVMVRWHDGDSAPNDESVIARRVDRIRRRDLHEIIEQSYHFALEDAGLSADDVGYVASTGEGELVDFRRGHFYGMTTHARGANFLVPTARGVLDVGGLHARAMRIDQNSRVLANRMTSQCASGSGQFLENVARYLGVALEEVGSLSIEARKPETISSICAVLAETDVINMVSQGVPTSDILKGIHTSMAGRYIKLLQALGVEGDVVVTGGLAADIGLIASMKDKVAEDGLAMSIRAHPWSVYAGALGAALWGGYRHRVLERRRDSGGI